MAWSFKDVGKTVLTGGLAGPLSGTLLGKNKTFDTRTAAQKAAMGDTYKQLNEFTDNPQATQVNGSVTENMYNQNVLNPALNSYNEQVNPQVKANFANNYWSSARQQGQQSAMQNLMNAANDQYSQMANADRVAQAGYNEGAMDRSLQANQMRGQMSTAQTRNTVNDGGLVGKLMSGIGAGASTAAMIKGFK